MKMRHFILKLILFLSVAILLDQFLGICLEELADGITLDSRARVRMEEFYRYKGNVDILFLGSSYAYMGFNPYIFDNALHVNSFNLGSSLQTPILTYYMLKEALRIGHKPRLIIIEVRAGLLKKRKDHYDYAAYIFRNMRFSKNKLSLLWNAFEFPSALKLTSRFHNDRHLIQLCGKSLAGADIGRYRGKGYVEYTSTVSQKTLAGQAPDFGELNLNPRQLSYLDRTVRFAMERGIRVIFVTTPMPPTVFRNSQRYKVAYDVIEEIAGKHGIDYIDYNLINEDLRIIRDENFKDSSHLNKSGVEILNKHFVQRLADIYETNL